MTGHTPWPLGQINPDLQAKKTEVFRFGEWSIYDTTGLVTGSLPQEKWSSYIMHCRTWTEWRRIKDPAKVNTWIKNEVVTGKPTHLTEKVTLHCTTNMVAYRNNRCPHCRMKIPEEVQGLWKMQNWDRIQELSNG